MYKLRRSRFVKFIAGVLVLILCAAIVFNVVGTFILMDENLYYATRQQLQQKVYSYIYDFTASDLMRYLNLTESLNNNDTEYQNYNDSEIQLYRSKYSPENSNIYFEICDENGNLLLNNDKTVLHSENVFTFSQVFINYYTAYGYNDGWYVKGDSYNEQISYIDEVTELTAVPKPYVTETYAPQEETTRFETTHASDDYAGSKAEELTMLPNASTPSSDKNDYLVQEYEITNSYSGKTVNLHYYYTDTVKKSVFEYCKSFLETLPYDITDFSFRQDEYYEEAYEYEDGDYVEIWPTYGASDAVPAISFETTLFTDGKEIELTYTYRGSLVLSEFRDRLKYLCLTAANISDENTSYSYMQKGNSQLHVCVSVPVYSDNAKDVYYYAEIFVDVAMAYKDNIISITVFYLLAVLLAIAYIFWSAGYVPGRDEPKAGGLHAIPFDIYLLLSIAAGVGCIGMCSTYDELFMITGATGLVFIALFFIYTLPVRIRAKTLFENTLITKIHRTVRHAAEITDSVKGSKTAIALTVLFFIAAMVCEILAFIIWGEDDAAAITMIITIIELPLIIFALVSLTALHNGAKQISSGDVSYSISTTMLFGPLKKHANYLNNINNAVNKAVAERMKSESLKTELITNVSHDLKTPLTSIVNYVDLLKKTDITDEKAIEYIEVIDRQSQRLKKLTFDIVEASKASTGNIEVHKEPTVLNVIIQQTTGEYIERLEENSLVPVTEIPDNSIIINTDGRLLWRVIDNLMNNICKYSMPGTRVYISLWQDENNAYISFRNISKSKLNISPDELTERFVRGDASRNTEGSGLGLSIAKSLTEVIGGRLKLIIDGDLFKVTLTLPLKN